MTTCVAREEAALSFCAFGDLLQVTGTSINCWLAKTEVHPLFARRQRNSHRLM